MKLNRLPLLSVGAIAVMLAVMASSAPAQDTSAPQNLGIPVPGQERKAEDGLTAEQRQTLAKKQNEQRQAELKKDTDKLLELATELKQYVDKTNQNVLSMDVIKKAEQIEKLAKAVKERMKGQ
jgi:hypothetical protein